MNPVTWITSWPVGAILVWLIFLPVTIIYATYRWWRDRK